MQLHPSAQYLSEKMLFFAAITLCFISRTIHLKLYLLNRNKSNKKKAMISFVKSSKIRWIEVERKSNEKRDEKRQKEINENGNWKIPT